MFSPEAIVQSLASDATESVRVEGVPESVDTGPLARRILSLAARDGLYLHHREHRVELPSEWTDRPTLLPEWFEGRLHLPGQATESLELLPGSFDPNASAVDVLAELARGLVGFAWKPDASPFQLACAARLARLVPRALQLGLAEEPASPAVLHFVDAELAAIGRSRRTGRMEGPRFGPYDPVGEALAWTAHHRHRLGSRSFQRLGWMFVPDGGHVGTLEALEARVEAVFRALLLGEPLTPHAPGPEAGRDRWIRQDLAARLLTVHAHTEGPAADALIRLVEQLDFLIPLPTLMQGYIELEETYVLPWSGDVFAIGRPLPLGFGRSVAQVAEGVRTACPLAADLLDRTGVDPGDFPDPPELAPVGDRFARWVQQAHPAFGPLAAFESAVCMVREDPVREGLGTEGPGELVLCEGARVLQAPYDVLALTDRIEAGEVRARSTPEGVVLDPAPPAEPTCLVIGRHAGEPVLVAVEPADGELLISGGSPEQAEELAGYGVMVRARHAP